VTQAARDLVMDIEDTGCRVKYLIRDRDGKYLTLFHAVLSVAGIEVVLSSVRMPRMNAVVERWVRTLRRESLDRTLIWEPAASAPRAAGVRAALQPSPAASRHRERSAARSATRTDCRPESVHLVLQPHFQVRSLRW
jgi:transposase InsO family protein